MPATLSSTKTRAALRTSARVSLHTLLILLLAAVALWVLGRMWSVVWPLVVALLLTTLTWPPVRFLRRHGWKPTLAASTVTVLFLLIGAGTIVVIAVPVASQSGELATGVVNGIQQLREWASRPPLNIGDDQVSQAFDAGVARIQNSVGSIVTAAVSGVSTVVNGVVTTVLALFLMFFFLKDGPRFLPWLTRQLPGRLATDVPTIAERSWNTLGSFVRSQAFVGLLDAVFIGVGLWILDVPLVLPLAVITFFAAFIPIIGAFVAGAFAVLIALVDEGFGVALAVLVIVLVVQQIEGNVLQPIIQGRGFNLHAAVVILAVTAGGSLAGITGAFLGVPVAALIAVTYRYTRDQLDGKSPEVTDDGLRTQVVGDDQGVRLAPEPVVPPGDRGPGPEEDAGA
jgi:putative heme transporter